MSDRPFTMADLQRAMDLVKSTDRFSYGLTYGDFTLGTPIAGVRIVTSQLLTETVQHSRSPARAKRRAAMGHRQHYRTVPSSTAYRIGDGTLVMHPACAAEIKARMDAEVAELIARR